MAFKLNVSVASYYEYKSGKNLKRMVHKALLMADIKKYFNESNRQYGSRRLSAELRSHDIGASHTTVAKYMHQMGLRSEYYRPKFRVTTDSSHNNNVAENLLDRNFTAAEPNKVWVSDITYVSVIGGFIYLTTIIDLYDRKVVGYHISHTMRAKDTVITALKMACKRRLKGGSAEGIMIHSDRGVQYTCGEFVKLLATLKMVRSNSRKGNCWDNAVAESFFKTLKCELVYQYKKLLSKEMMETKIFEYIECWYNSRRRHSALGNMSINEFYGMKKSQYYKNNTAS